MTAIFGPVADDYDELRPGYPDSIAAAILDCLGGTPSSVTEIGAGTGKATAVFAQLGAPLRCIEPDPRMAARLMERFPGAEIVVRDIESWTPPAGGVPVLAGALVWHLLDPQRRRAMAHAALEPDGLLALVGRKNSNTDPRQKAALDEAFHTNGWPIGNVPHTWIADDLVDSGLFSDVITSRHDTAHTVTGPEFLRLVSTYSPFRRLPPSGQEQLLAALRDVVDSTGGIVHEELQTTLCLARRR